MKKFLSLLLAMGLICVAMAQLKVKTKCPTLEVDILNGNINHIKPDYPIPEIKAQLPCFSSAEDEGPNAKCGGGVFYNDQDVYFYTQRDYIQIGEKFKGHLSIPLLGADRKNLFKWLGNAKLKDDTWDAFQMAYGTLVLRYNAAGKVKLIQFSTRGTDEMSICE
jgi:hypothetical protein